MPRRWFPLLVLGLLVPAAAPLGAQAPPTRSAPLVVGTKVAPPFAMKDAAGAWTGISIELWRRIAAELGLEYRFEEVPLERLVDGVADGSLDLSVAAITMTPEREARVDFTYAYVTSGLAIATTTAGRGWWGAVRRFLSIRFLEVVGLLLVVLLAVGFLVWLFERRRNPGQFGGSPAHGLGAGMWWSAVTMTTVGYGDKAPVTVGGRIVALIWMFTSLIVISAFTAAITSSLTLSGLSGLVEGPQDLPDVGVAAVTGSTGARWLDERAIDATLFSTPEAAVAALREGRVDAVVHDGPIIAYLSRRDAGLHVLPHRLDEERYGIALPTGSPLREPINRVLLAEVGSPDWEELVRSYLGEED